MNRSTQLLSGHTRRRQEEAIARTDGIGAGTDRIVRAVWHRLLVLLRDADDPFEVQVRAEGVLRDMIPGVVNTLLSRLRSQVKWGLQSAKAGIRRVLPKAALRESSTVSPDTVELREERSPDFLDMLFPAPSEADIAELMGTDWLAVLGRSTRLAAPGRLAAIIGAGYAAGNTQNEIARDLLPAVNGVRVSARRVARTEGLRIAHVAQMRVHEQLGDLVDGYTIRATLDRNTRLAHAARDGLTWRKDSGQTMQVALRMEGPTLPDGFN